MADQARSDSVAVAGQGQVAGPTAEDKAALAAATGAAAAPEGRHGRPISWASVIIMIVGFLAGGAGLVFGPTWWLFWVGGGLAALGGILALGTGIFNDWY
jgi:fatty acid desaturase